MLPQSRMLRLSRRLRRRCTVSAERRVGRLWSRQVKFGKRKRKLGGCAMGEPAISFGPFRLLAAQRLLLEGDKPVRLGSRAFDVLTALVERAGEVVNKEELIARAWPKTFVEEANLKIQVSALRRALGDGQGDNRYVVNVVGRGYNFVAPIRKEEPSRASSSPTIAPAAPHNLPFATTRMIGREEPVTTLVTQLSHRRLVTVVGPGGIGKTTVALAVAERMIGAYEHGVWLVDLAPLGDPGLVPSALATVLGLEVCTENSLPSLVAALRDSRMLLLLDNCEHVIDAAAGLAAALISGASGIDILATSREPLGVQGERVHRLGPLSSPEPSPGLTAKEAAAFPAVQLFVERVTAIVEDFTLTDANTRLVVAICRRLDGLPLAIEFAAPRVEVLGVEALAERLNDSLRLLGGQRRAAMPRHRTMQAVADWSYGLLSQDEQRFFRALGIFTGGFTVAAAADVAMDATTTGADAIDRLADLVAKSLVVADASGTGPRFRMLDTTRAYAIEKLNESSERERIARRHAEYYRDLFERAEREVPARPPDEWLADYALEIDNLRAALNWAFSPDGDESIGVLLTAAAVSLWRRLSLLEECRSHAKQAFHALATARNQDPYAEMRLNAALGAFTTEVTEMGAAFTNALAIAESLGDPEYQLRALGGLYFFHAASCRFRAAQPFAQKLLDLAASRSDLSAQLFGEHLVGMAKHLLGDQISARRHLEQVLTHYAPTNHHGRDVVPSQDIIRFQISGHVSARVILARVLWLQGFSDQAMRTAEISIEEAKATGHAVSLCYALTSAACPIALWVGNLSTAAHYTGMLVDSSRKHDLPLWSAFGSWFQQVVVLMGGDMVAGAQLLDTSLDRVAQFNLGFRSTKGLPLLVEALGRAGRVAEGLALVEAGIEQFEANWVTPELVRLEGELSLLQGMPGAAVSAELHFRQALDGAREHGALSWELRAATSLARLLLNQGHPADATACLQPIYDRFTEGFITADLIAAKQLLDDLGVAEQR
jgi:predicted ATPase/DNA-binding winged helix-turn-helix (wHTH) protein